MDKLNESQKKEKNAREMFEKLRQHIGETVSVKAWWYGSEYPVTSILRGVNDFWNIELDSCGIPFIGYGSAIVSITLDETGEVLYSNPSIEDEYDRRNQDKIEAAKREFFGDEIADEQIAERLKYEAEREKRIEEADQAAKEAKPRLIKEGLELVKPETRDEWVEFADKNSNDGYSVFIVKAAISMMRKFEEGVPFEEADQQVFCDEFGLSGFMAGACATTLAHFAKQGEEFRIYWNKQYGIEDSDQKGTANPAVYTLKK